MAVHQSHDDRCPDIEEVKAVTTMVETVAQAMFEDEPAFKGTEDASTRCSPLG